MTTKEKYIKASKSSRDVFNDESLNAVKGELNKVINVLDSVINGNDTLTGACDKQGLDTLKTRSVMYHVLGLNKLGNVQYLQDYIKTTDFLSNDEKFYRDVFGVYRSEDINNLKNIMPSDSYQTMLYILEDECLSDRERGFLKSRYVDGMTLNEVGDQFEISRERVRQIVAKGLRKLKHPSRAQILSMGIQDYMDYKDIYERERQERLNKLVNDKLDRDESLQPKNERNPKLGELNLSIRAYNCLRRAGYHHIRDLEGKTLDDLYNVRNLGKKSVYEIIEVAKEYGVTIID